MRASLPTPVSLSPPCLADLTRQRPYVTESRRCIRLCPAASRVTNPAFLHTPRLNRLTCSLKAKGTIILPAGSVSNPRPPVVNLPRERTAELESDIAATKERVAAAEKIVVSRLHYVNDKLEQLRHRERVLDARSSSGNVHTHPQRYSRPAQASLPRAEQTRARPLLHVFGDSFVGPFTLYQPAEVRVTKYKGASAQGLGNPHSALQVGPDVAHRLREYITAPGNRSKSALLMFGSVDLHINHLHHVTTKSIARHLPPEQRKQSMIPFAEHAMTGLEYAQKAFESYRRFLLNDIVRSETGDFVRDHAYNPNAPRILVAAAAPPMVEDQYLEAIRLKYILPHQSTPKDWAEKEPSRSPTPPSSPVSSRASTPSSTSSSSTASINNAIDGPQSVRAIIEQNLGLLDLASRIQATRHFNSELRSFCRQHPDVLHFVDITPLMVLPNMTPGEAEPAVEHDVDRVQFGDRADPTNVHVDWEATLPLWEEELGWVGVPVEQFKYRTSLEETARAFSAEKSERVKRRSWRLETDVLAEREQKMGKMEVEKVEVKVRVEPVCEDTVSTGRGEEVSPSPWLSQQETHALMVDKMLASETPELVQEETVSVRPKYGTTDSRWLTREV